jgi:hypothetical protein
MLPSSEEDSIETISKPDGEGEGEIGDVVDDATLSVGEELEDKIAKRFLQGVAGVALVMI